MISFHHPHVDYVEVDFPPPIPDQTEVRSTGYEYSLSKEIARKNADKARKIRIGLDHAQRYQPTHSMVVDADDCVSRRLAEFVEQHSQGSGWYFKKGYFFTEGSRFLYLNRRNFNVVCGTSVVIAYHLRNLLFANPDFYQHAFLEPPDGVLPLPFVGAVYSMANGDNIYMSPDIRNQIYATLLGRVFSTRIFSVVGKVTSYWPWLLTNSLRAEYGLYKLTDMIPVTSPAVCQTSETLFH